MSFKRKIFNIFAAVVMVFGSVPFSFTNTFAAEGDTPTGDVPQHSKTVTPNGDGTYNITLSVTGKQSSNASVSKANVVVVFDTSNSMEYGTSCTRDYSYNNNDTDQYGFVNNNYVPLYRRNGVWRYGNAETRYDGEHYNCASDRLTVAQGATTNLISKLLANNSLEGADSDTVEISLVNFATGVRSTTNWSTNETTLNNVVNGYDVPRSDQGGTNWEAALSSAKTLVNNRISSQSGESNYVIFVSDGDPTFRDSQMGSNNAGYYGSDWNNTVNKWGTGNSDPNSWNFNAAKSVADSIAGLNNTTLYTVGAFGDADVMESLAGSDHYYDASDQTALENAFRQIVDQITDALSITNLKFTDGITALTTAAVSGNPDNFIYTKGGAAWTDAPEAEIKTIDGTKTVVWDLGDTTLKDGETATVSFTVWPSQASYDILADLNNGKITYDSLTDAQKASIVKDGDSYSLQTNTKWPTLTYSTVETVTVNGVSTTTVSDPTTITIENDGPMPLDTRKLTLEKKWEDSLDSSQREEVNGKVVLDFYKDNQPYESNIELTETNNWKLNDYISIAPGVMISNDSSNYDLLKAGHTEYSFGGKKYIILETGHDYYFEEKDINNHFELTNYIYHPMIIDNVLKNVFFTRDASDNITGIEKFEDMNSVSATNTLKGGILVGKTVINNDKEDKTIEDEYDITITLSKDTGVYRIYTYNPDGTEKERSEEKTYAGGVINEKITVNQKIRVQDVPTGTTYEVTEVLPNGYTRNKVDYTVVMYDGTDDKDGVQEVFGNASAQATVTNYLESGDLIIKKTVTASSGDLEQAQNQEFSFTVNFYKSQDKTELMRTDTETCKAVKHNETCEIKNIPKGWYYEIVEAAKPGFNNGDETTKTGTIKKGDNEETFINDYAVTPLNPDDAKILVDKAFASGYEPFWIAADTFTFVMTGNGKTVESTPLTLSGRTAEFVPEITDAGTYTYTITEKTTDETGKSLFREGVSRFDNDEDIIVTIVARDKGDGTLELVSKTYSKESKTIYNKYEGDNTYGGKSGELEFTKNLTGRDWQSSDKFNFTIASQDKDAPMPERTTITADKDHKTVGFGKIKFTNKDVGNTYTYTVTESFDVPSVEATGTSAGGISLTIAVSYNTTTGKIDLTVSNYEDTFTNEYKTTNVTAAKKWDDENNRDGLRKNYNDYYVAVKNDEGKFVAYEKLALEDKNDYEFTDLPEKNAEGAVINYEIVEASICSGSGESIQCTEFEKDENYTATVDGYTITNFHEPALYNDDGDLTVQKIWAGEGNDLVRPNTITIELYANGSRLGEPVTISAANEWKYTFKNLYLNEGGKPIVYTVQESKLGETAFGEDESVIVIVSDDGISEGTWTKSENNDKHEVTNTWNRSAAKSLTIKKTVEGLSADVLSNLEFTITGPEDFGDNGKMTLKASKDCTTAGKVITCKVSDKVPTGKYTVKESNAEVENFTLTITGDDGATKKAGEGDEVEFAITNSYEKIRDVHYKVKKIWDDNDDQDGLRPDKLTITLMRKGSGKAEEYRTVELTDDKLEHEWTNLPRADENAVAYTYSVVEEEISDYESDGGKMVGDTFTFTNKHEPATKELKFKKVWNVSGDRLPSVAPTFITVELTNDKNTEKKTIRLDGTGYGEWESDAIKVAVYANQGETITYSVKETKIGDDVLSSDNNDTIYVYSGNVLEGKWVAENTDGLTVENTWTPTTDKIEYEGKSEFMLSKVDEDGEAMEGVTFTIGGKDYTTDGNGEIIVKVPVSTDKMEESFEYQISEKETWEGYDTVDGSATVTVSCKSEFARSDEATLVNTYTKNCEFDKKGSEDFAWNGSKLILTVTNNRSLADSITIRKKIEGLDASVLSENGLTFTLSGPDDFEPMEIKLSDFKKVSEGVYEYTFDGRIPTGEYKVVESGEDVEYFTVTVSGSDKAQEVEKDDETVFEIVNEYVAENTSYAVVKIWDDAHDKDGKRPDELEVRLLANGEVIDTVYVSMVDAVIVGEEDEEYSTGDVWVYVWEELPMADEYAELISYTVEEVLESDDYEQTDMEGDEYYTLFVNSHQLEDPCAEGGCGGDIIPPATPETGRATQAVESREAVVDNTFVLIVVIAVSAVTLFGAAKFAKRK